ncbi:MAG: acetylxylan esterase [Planctomycetia bacterium]|nr:acetylxylan esterase [Planctomycetia bacterium]
MTKLITRLSLAVLFQFCLAAALVAANYSFFGTTDKNPLEYQPGEEMVFQLQVLDDGKPVDGVRVKWTRTGDDGETATGEAVSSATEPILVKTSLKTPGFVYLLAVAVDENGNALRRNPEPQYCKNVEFYGGAGVLLDKIAGAPEPEDFDAFWTRQKARLAEIPMDVELVPVESGSPEVACYDVKVKCVGMPVSGYLCMPKEAKEKSLGAHVSFHGYGFSSAYKPVSEGKKMIAFNINAHGYLNGQPQEYYDEMSRTTLKSYGFNNEENQNPETAYFNGMILRVIRALEFVKSRPEWNGKDLIVSGGSQGGFQCLSAAGLDADVSECRAHVAWCLDLSGHTKMNRLNGWRPGWTEALGYYDPANHAKRTKCPVYLTAGLGDYVCPPSGQMVYYNNLQAPKRLIFNQGCTHGYSMPKCPSFTLTNIEEK